MSLQEAGRATDTATIRAMHALWLSATSRLPATQVYRRRTIVLELVGPAGAGKTALRRLLAARAADAVAGVRVDRRRDLPAAAASILPLLPRLGASAVAGTPAWSWRCAQQLVRLDALRRAVQRVALASPGPVVLDEGPVFTLAKLRLLFAEVPASRQLTARWDEGLEPWRRVLDVVVWVDAPDEVLTRRIRSRAKAHRVKNASDARVQTFLAAYREAYGHVLSRLTGYGGPRLLRFGTGAEPVDATAARVLEALGLLDRSDS